MRQLIALAGVLLLAGACSNDDDEPLRKFISFKVDSVIVLSENPDAVLTPGNTSDTDPNNDYPTLAITGAGSGNTVIRFNLISPTEAFQTGTYPGTQQGNNMAVTFNSDTASLTLLADDQHGAFNFNMVTVQDTLLEAHFSATLVDTTGVLSNKEVTEGYIRAIMKRH